MIVRLPSPLLDYTKGLREVEAEGATLDALLIDLDQRYPGIRFRMIDEQGCVRPHIKLFVDKVIQRDLRYPVDTAREIDVVAALSGG